VDFPGAVGNLVGQNLPSMDALNRYKKPVIIAIAAVIVYLVTLKPVFLHENGEYLRFFTHAFSEPVALRDAGVEISNGDRISSGALSWGAVLEVHTGRWMEIIYQGAVQQVSVSNSDPVPASVLLDDAGIQLAAEEWPFADGTPLQSLDAEIPVPNRLEIRNLIPVQIRMDGEQKEYRVPGPTVGDAVWQAGIRLRRADAVNPPPETPLTAPGNAPVEIDIRRAGAIRIRADGKEISTFAAGKTVGEAVARAGIALTNLDFTVPPETDPMPADGVIRVVRVREEFLREQEPIPFDTETLPSAELELDQKKWIQAGVPGILEKSIRVRYEDGVETARAPEGEVVVLPPQTRILGYGTKIVIRTLDTPNGPVEYWRAVPVYATSYSPCRLGVTPPRCGYLTFSGKRVDRGMIAMVQSWYYQFHGQAVYVPGYGRGVVEDVGYPSGTTYAPFWIDLFYLDDEWRNWHQWTTLYFLTPVPASFPYLLQ
jgi:uncharacterized protein YabE (DUF348 family)